MEEGKLRQAAHGIFYAPRQSWFGEAPPSSAELMRVFLDESPFVITGPPVWNTLGLGSTAMFAATLVYNTRRTGSFTFDGRPFLLRRVLFPAEPSTEWYVVDLLQHHDMVGLSLSDVQPRLVQRLKSGCWDTQQLLDMAERYGTKATQAFLKECVKMASID